MILSFVTKLFCLIVGGNQSKNTMDITHWKQTQTVTHILQIQKSIYYSAITITVEIQLF